MHMYRRVFTFFLLLAVLSACGKNTPTWQEQYDLGIRYLSEGNYEEAIIAFTAAIEIDSKRAEAYEKLADTYGALGDNESALAILRQGAKAIGDDILFQDYIDELTAETDLPPESTPDPVSSGPRVERGDHPDGRYWLRYYDEVGIKTREERYNPDDALIDYWLFYYDEMGNQTREERYYADGTPNYYLLSYYDEVGNLMRDEWYNFDGTLSDAYDYAN